MSEGFTPEAIPPSRAVATALVLLLCDGLVHSHARQVLAAVLDSAALDDELRVQLCERVLYEPPGKPALEVYATTLLGRPRPDQAARLRGRRQPPRRRLHPAGARR